MIDDRVLRAFVAVAQQGSFSRAAAELGYSQPAITHQVRQLEASLRVTLFDRSTVPLRLTAQGRARLLVVEAIIGLIDGIREDSGEVGGVSARGRVIKDALRVVP